jgi:hypothetical protein
MNQWVSKAFGIFLAACAFLQPTRAKAFALLGPYEPWMQNSNCFRLTFTPVENAPGDIGGPMCLSNGYRWNVPVVTYGFDQSFMDFFGSNGVAAVEGAIQMLNDLPPASSIQMSNYYDDTLEINYQAQSELLYDLKSQTLALLLEQLGLASPTRSIYVERAWNPLFAEGGWAGVTNAIPDYIVMRNYDPVTLDSSQFVNEFLYLGNVWSGFGIGLDEFEIETSPFDLEAPYYSAVADNRLNIGDFYIGPTMDDVSGLSYLFSQTNIHYEQLLYGVSGAGTNASSWVNGAWRPGIDKITFVPQPTSSPAQFLPLTNQYNDTYITNGIVTQQQLQRVVTQPDFLFKAGDTAQYPIILPFTRTGTSNWINNAALNGNPSGAGPGIIQPPVQITFGKLGPRVYTYGSGPTETILNETALWGSYDDSTNPPVIYPTPPTDTNQLTVRLFFLGGEPVNLFATGQAGVSFVLQMSIDLINWTPIMTVQIDGSIPVMVEDPQYVGRFYRLVPQ